MMVIPKESRTKRIAIICIALAILGPAAYGFIEKLALFIMAVRQDQLAGITVVPITNYLIVTGGMICLLIWATRNGMFRDIERPKYEFLEREEELDRQETAGRGGAR